MMCYRDMTFCPYHENCRKGHNCPRAYTGQVKRGAHRWMGENAPVCMYSAEPECYQKLNLAPIPSCNRNYSDATGCMHYMNHRTCKGCRNYWEDTND